MRRGMVVNESRRMCMKDRIPGVLEENWDILGNLVHTFHFLVLYFMFGIRILHKKFSSLS